MPAPTYPLAFPTTVGVQKSNWGLRRAVGLSESPFTGAQQVYEHTMALWTAVITLPPMSRAQAVDYQTFFMQLCTEEEEHLQWVTQMLNPNEVMQHNPH